MRLRNKEAAKYIVMDAGYKTPAIARAVLEDGKVPVMPYTRPMTKEGFYKKYEYVYDEYYDCYICPENQILRYSTTNREGYREYKSNAIICENCKNRYRCTESQNYTKIVTRHVWEPYMEQVEDYRHMRGMKHIYQQRKETIERVFADAKEKHGMRYTQYRGLAKVKMELTLLFGCMNLKKMANWKWKNRHTSSFFIDISQYFIKNKEKWLRSVCFKTTLSISFPAYSGSRSFWRTHWHSFCVPRCRGQSDGWINAACQSQRTCNRCQHHPRSYGRGRGVSQKRQSSGSLGRCCGCGYKQSFCFCQRKYPWSFAPLALLFA